MRYLSLGSSASTSNWSEAASPGTPCSPFGPCNEMSVPLVITGTNPSDVSSKSTNAA